MKTSALKTIEQVREFLAGTAEITSLVSDSEAVRHAFIARVLEHFRYDTRTKGQRSVLFAYMQRLSSYSHSHLCRLIAQYRESYCLQPRTHITRTSFAVKYTPADVALLAELDAPHDTLSGPATKVLAQRALMRFGDTHYARLAGISVSRLYNLRASAHYQKLHRVWRKTRPSGLAVGVRLAPAPQGLPGYIRIDSVHQGDLDGARGVYHINAVDIVTQRELVAAVECISEAYHLLPVIGLLLAGFP